MSGTITFPQLNLVENLRHQASRHIPWMSLFLGFFIAMNWQEVTSPTYNVDDWVLIGDVIDQIRHSRPTWNLVYKYGFSYSYMPAMGWLIAAFAIYGSAACVSFFAPRLTPPWIFLLASLVSAHANFLDLFNFSFAIGLYVLPAVLSILAALMMGYCQRHAVSCWFAGTSVLAFAMGIYQPTGVYGIAVIGLQFVSEALGIRSFPRRSILRVASGMALGGLLYLGISQWLLIGLEPREGHGFATPHQFFQKASTIETYARVYATKVELLPRAPQLLFFGVFLFTLLLATWSVIIGRTRHQMLSCILKLWLGAGCLVVLPVVLSFVLVADYPPRAMALGNFGISSFSIVALCYAVKVPGTVKPIVVMVWLVTYLVPQFGYASKMWELIQLVEKRDIALAQSIVTDVRFWAREHKVSAESFLIFGYTHRTEMFPHWNSVGRSAFTADWSIRGIFKNLHGVDVTHISYADRQIDHVLVRALLPACSPYPYPNSINHHEGRIVICLQPNVGLER